MKLFPIELYRGKAENLRILTAWSMDDESLANMSIFDVLFGLSMELQLEFEL